MHAIIALTVFENLKDNTLHLKHNLVCTARKDTVCYHSHMALPLSLWINMQKHIFKWKIFFKNTNKVNCCYLYLDWLEILEESSFIVVQNFVLYTYMYFVYWCFFKLNWIQKRKNKASGTFKPKIIKCSVMIKSDIQRQADEIKNNT